MATSFTVETKRKGRTHLESGLPEIETYTVQDHSVYVVRDDLCSLFPIPNNSKIRGVEAKLLQLRKNGIDLVASQDTSISRIGWAVSCIAKRLDMTHFNFYFARQTMNFYQCMSKSFGGVMIPLHGTFSNTFRALALKYMKRHGIDDYVKDI